MDLLKEFHDFGAEGVEVGVDRGEVARGLILIKVVVEGDFVADEADLVVLGVALSGVDPCVGHVGQNFLLK